MVWSPRTFKKQYSLEGTDFEVEDLFDECVLEDTDSGDLEFTPCPLCSSNHIVGLVDFSGDLQGRYLCRSCWCEFSIHESDDGEGDGEEDDSEEETVVGMIVVCPHCASINSIACYGDKEWCEDCWLEPDELNQESPVISSLFKGGIARILEDDSPMCRPQGLLGKFVRQECGPHCTLAKNCPQNVGNLVKCFREEFSEEEKDSEIVGKRKRGKKGKGRKKNKLQNRIREHKKNKRSIGPPKVAFFCSKGGLLEKMMYGVTDPDTEQPGNTGSQSGA